MPAEDAWSRIELQQGDITKLAVNAIVNAANSALAGGGGVDGAIHRAAGAAQLHEACRRLGGCDTGNAKITPGFNLPAPTSSTPSARSTPAANAASLNCSRPVTGASLEIASENGLKSIAFPAISTGVYGYPFAAATEIALRTTADSLGRSTSIERVIFVFFSPADFDQATGIRPAFRGG